MAAALILADSGGVPAILGTSMTFADAVGTLGALLTTVCWLPQVVRAVHGKDTRAISLPAFVALAVGVTCWLVYGLAIGDLLIGANGVSLMLILIILAAKLCYG
jgi:MtN3 and saliva related transmembrane protein